MEEKEYALYKGEKLLSMGTVEEIAYDMGVKKETILYYKTDAHKRKSEKRNAKRARVLVELENGEE